MKDGYNRNINYMRLSVTDRCNFRCKYCMSDNCTSHVSEELSFDELYDISKVAIECGVSKIRITGGEPLTRNGVVDFCGKLSSINGLDELTMTTNGSLLKEYAVPLKNARVNRLNISLDTLCDSKFKEITKTDRLNDVIEGIRAAIKAGFEQIKINVVLIGGFNTDEIDSFVNLTRDNDVSIRFIELMPIGICSTWDEKCFVSDDIVLSTVPQLKKVSSDGVAQIYKVEGHRGSVGLIRPMSQKFCDVCNRVRVTADGKLKTCLHSNDEYDLKGLSEQELLSCFKNAIINKPSCHNLTSTCHSSANRNMHQIGG